MQGGRGGRPTSRQANEQAGERAQSWRLKSWRLVNDLMAGKRAQSWRTASGKPGKRAQVNELRAGELAAASELRAHGPRGSMAHGERAQSWRLVELAVGERPDGRQTSSELVNTSRMQIVQPKLVHIVRF